MAASEPKPPGLVQASGAACKCPPGLEEAPQL